MAEPTSLRTLKKQAAEAAASQAAEAVEGDSAAAEAMPVEMERFLTDDDFRRIRALQVGTSDKHVHCVLRKLKPRNVFLEVTTTQLSSFDSFAFQR